MKPLKYIYQLYNTYYKIFNSDYSNTEKWELLFTFINLRLKIVLSSKNINNKIRNIRLFKYNLSTFNYVMFLFVFEEIFINEIYKFDCKSNNPFIIDCGANMGLATLYFKLKYPNSIIIAFEPDKDVYKLLEKNIYQNNISGVKLINAALSSVNGKLEFYSSFNETSWNFGVGSISLERRGMVDKIEVDSVILSQYIDREVDFVKMDIEGSEYIVIKELYDKSKLHLINELIIEYHHKIAGGKSKLSEFLSIFEDISFEYQIEASRSIKNQFQDIVIHCYRPE